MRRSVVSIPSNIAEGQARNTTGEFRQFLGIAGGSNSEVQTQIGIARALDFGDSASLKLGRIGRIRDSHDCNQASDHSPYVVTGSGATQHKGLVIDGHILYRHADAAGYR
ncbi:MAG: four helix bundle protein [Terracidiphilus sp.]